MWHIVKQETDGEREGHEKLGHVAGPDTRVPLYFPLLCSQRSNQHPNHGGIISSASAWTR